MFEAVVKDEDVDVADGDICDDEITDQVHRQESAVVIQELRSVLAVKTNDQHREIRKRKLFPDFWAKKPFKNTTCDETDVALRKNGSIHEDVQLIISDLVNRVVNDLAGNKTPMENTSPFQYFKRSAPRNRRAPTRTSKMRAAKQNNNTSCYTQYDFTNDDGNTEHEEHCDSNNWTDGIGIGFSASLAMQVAAMARQRREPDSFELISNDTDEQDIIS